MTIPSVLPALTATDSQVVLRHGDPQFADQFGARDVWVFESDGTYYLHYDAAGPEGWLAALATSSDGLHWHKRGPLLSLGDAGAPDSGSASYGTTYRDGERWHMFYLGTPHVTPDEIKVPAFPYLTLKAESTSPGGPWTKRPDIIPFAPVPGTWYSDTASPGQIVRRPSDHLMIFSASTTRDGQIYRTLGLATTTDLDGPWTVADEPILPLTEQIENSSLYFEPVGGWWFLFTNHVGEAADLSAVAPQSSTEYTDAIWVYWSKDLEHWDPAHKAEVLNAAQTGWSPRIVGLPSVVPIAGRLAVYYDGLVEDSIAHGHRDVGVAWLDLPLTPPTPSPSLSHTATENS
jgi:predicted GH43/DUF377 family glycosyl hydrolase